MSSTALTRRALIAGAGAVASLATIGTAASATDVCELVTDPETEGLTGLPLAAVHIRTGNRGHG
ncbi:hypothetical protein N8D56_04870 [Devosia sp. A8/3-2]|nr:hypothetical protein N8D56_04870 [Devosia sp. A8/3-2]